MQENIPDIRQAENPSLFYIANIDPTNARQYCIVEVPADTQGNLGELHARMQNERHNFTYFGYNVRVARNRRLPASIKTEQIFRCVKTAVDIKMVEELKNFTQGVLGDSVNNDINEILDHAVKLTTTIILDRQKTIDMRHALLNQIISFDTQDLDRISDR